ncbi:MAG: ABC transporter permease, partial [Chloroflexi bacterium]|nr:ABC transporter permease [Chloroflexota bacterium]
MPTKRNTGLGVFFILVGLAIYLLFIRTSEAGQTATFGMNPGRVSNAIEIPDLTLPVVSSLYIMAAAAIFFGGYQLAKGFGRLEGAILGLVALFLTLSFLAWAARGGSLNLLGILETALQRATPIALAGLSGVLCERSGVINIAIEGMMLTAALASAVVGSLTKSLWVGLISSLLICALLGALLAVLSIRYRVNQ